MAEDQPDLAQPDQPQPVIDQHPAALFTADELFEWLGTAVTPQKAVLVERVVWGWLKSRLGLTERPAHPTPEQVFSWAIELAAIAYENPAGLSSEQLDGDSRQYSRERREEILAEAERGGVSSTTPPAPRGRFPASLPYPEAVR